MINKKFYWFIRRLRFSLLQTPHRIARLFTIWSMPFYQIYPISVKINAFLMALLDLFFLFDMIEITNNLVRPHIRTLTEIEILRGSKMFGTSLDFSLVLLDKRSAPVKRGFAYAFVTFNTINCWKPIPADVFIHELTHVWQYQNFGAGYIPAALWAQKSPGGYNYAYTEGWYLSTNLFEFNAEQQADLIQDAYRLQNRQSVQWANARRRTDEVRRLTNTILT